MRVFKAFCVFKIHCSVVTHVLHQCRNSSSKHNLIELLTMPRDTKHTVVLKKQRQKLKEKILKRSPFNVYLQVIGSGTIGAPRSLYMFTDQTE